MKLRSGTSPSTRAASRAQASSKPANATRKPPKRRLPPTPVSAKTKGKRVETSQDTSDDEVLLTPRPKRTHASARKAKVYIPPTPEPTPVRANKRRKLDPDTRSSVADTLPSPILSRASSPSPEIQAALDASVVEDDGNSTTDVLVEEDDDAQVDLEEPSVDLDVLFPNRLLQPLASHILSTLRGHAQPFLPGASMPKLLPQARGKDRAPATSSPLAQQPYLLGLEAHERDLRATLDRTVSEGEGNCLLLVGPRGVGKTAIVRRTLNLLQQAHGPDGFFAVHLSGLVQTTDRLTLREIARQLCASDTGLDEDSNAFNSNAATLSALMAILEPKTISLQDSNQATRPIIFILDEFDLFALRDQRQSFLYCLLDIVQSGRRTGGMAVVGLSARGDCINVLEKRLKSRCQSRVRLIGQPADLQEYRAVALSCLKIDPASAVLSAAAVLPKAELLQLEQLCRVWNERGAKAFLNRKDVTAAAAELYSITANKAVLLNSVAATFAAVVSRAAEQDAFTVNRLLEMRVEVPQQNDVLRELSIVEVAVLFSIKHALVVAKEEGTFNFASAFDIYQEHARRSTTRSYSQAVFHKAFEHLRQLGIIQTANPTKSKMSRGGVFQLNRLLPFSAAIDRMSEKHKGIPELLKRWCKDREAS